MAPNASQWSVVHLMVCSCEIGKRCVLEVRTVIPGSSKKLSVSFIWSEAILATFARVRLLPAFLSTSTTEKAKAMPATQKLSANWHPLPYLYKTLLDKYGNGCQFADNFCVAGMAFAFSVVDVLKKAGSNLTRSNVVKIAAEQMNEKDNFLLLPGITVRTSKTHRFPISQLPTIMRTTVPS